MYALLRIFVILKPVFMKAKDILVRYGISTLGLILVAFGVSLSIKSNFGVAPPSCPPTAIWSEWPALSFGTYTWAFNCGFILVQLLLQRKKFPWFLGLMQVLACGLFGVLCNLSNRLFFADVLATSLEGQLLLLLGAIVVTAIGIKLEVLGKGWILPVDQMNAVITEMGKFKYSNVKIVCDICLVATTSLFCWIAFGSLLGSPDQNIVFWGTLILAFGVGLCMKLTDPLMDKLFGRFVK